METPGRVPGEGRGTWLLERKKGKRLQEAGERRKGKEEKKAVRYPQGSSGPTQMGSSPLSPAPQTAAITFHFQMKSPNVWK